MDAKQRAAAKQVRELAAHEIYAEAARKTDSIPMDERSTYAARSAQAEIGFLKYAIGQLTAYRDSLKAGPAPKEQFVTVRYSDIDWQVTYDDDGDVTGYCVAGQELCDMLDDMAKFSLDLLAEPLIAAAARELAGDFAIDRFEAQRDRSAA